MAAAMQRYSVTIVLTNYFLFSAMSIEARDSIEFARDIQPLLQQHCAACHAAEERNGGLSFEDRATAFAAADSGEKPIVAGIPDASEVVKRISSQDEELRMPPEGEPLSAEQIETIRSWIAEGATWPEKSGVVEAGRATHSHWSFQPVSHPRPPPVKDPSWPRGPMDQFIQAAREQAGLAVAPDADAVTLIRRASYGLTGLPPTPKEVEDFLAVAQSPIGLEAAFAELVDRLLNQVSYGQRWGRHWMDWVRYADTAGDNSDFPIPQAYLYRNYIIDAFNGDLPYNRFLTEQLAGDLLPADTQAERNRLTTATGYLAMARRFGSLIERYPWHLTIEDTIDNVGRNMMGLTIACARCHDHKFDPISTRDYYGLYGIFESTQYPQPGLELFQAQQNLVPLIPNEQVDAILSPYRVETERLNAELEKLFAACERRALKNAEMEIGASLAVQRKMGDELDAMLLKARRAGEALAAHLKKIPDMPVAYAVQDGLPRNARIQIKGEPTRLGAEVERKFPDVLGSYVVPPDVADVSSGRLQLANWIASENNPLTARVIVNRVWQRHFGQGIVASTSDFGVRGQLPSHPALLDWLTTEFIASGWSIKQLHRTIMTSHTYQLSSLDVEENLTSDPGNRYCWKFNRQRLDAESIRDTLLKIAGTLDSTPQTEPYPIPPQKDWKYTQHHPFKDEYASHKRSVYLMTKRLTAEPYFQTFDGPDPNVCTSDRDESVTPLQALYFVNNEFLHQQAEQFTKSLLQTSELASDRVEYAVTSILCRQPTAAESQFMLDHVAAVEVNLAGASDGEQQAWSSLVRSLLRLNEFLYID